MDLFTTLPFSTIEGKVIKKSTTMIMTMTMKFQNFLTKPLFKSSMELEKSVNYSFSQILRQTEQDEIMLNLPARADTVYE